MLALDQVAAYIKVLCGGDVAGMLEVAHDQTSQQAQAEWVISIRLTGGFNFCTSTADALRVEELHGISRMELNQFLFATALQKDAGAAHLSHCRPKPTCEKYFAM